MIGILIKKVIGTKNDRELRRLAPIVGRINTFESALASLTDSEIKAKTADFRGHLASGAALNDILPEVFAVVREASRRALGMRHFDVQLLGGVVLHEGKIAEMKTGEGKTLVATLPLYLNALLGKGVHVITVNNYLAQRDSELMGELYGFLGMTVGCNLHGLSHDEKQEAYACDITYGTNN